MITLAEIESWGRGGGSETIEFRRTTGERREAARAICAMLNQRWENQPAAGWSVADLDEAEIARTREESIRRGRADDPGTRDPAEVLRGLGLMKDGQILRAAAVLFGRGERIEAELPQGLLRVARFRGKGMTPTPGWPCGRSLGVCRVPLRSDRCAMIWRHCGCSDSPNPRVMGVALVGGELDDRRMVDSGQFRLTLCHATLQESPWSKLQPLRAPERTAVPLRTSRISRQMKRLLNGSLLAKSRWWGAAAFQTNPNRPVPSAISQLS